MQQSQLAINGVTWCQGTVGITRYCRAAVTAIQAGPLADRATVWFPSCLRAEVEKVGGLTDRVRFFAAPDPDRGFSFGLFFWSNLLALNLRLERRPTVLFSPIECFSVVPFPHPVMTVHDCYADHFGDPSKGGRIGWGRRLCLRQFKRSHLLPVSHFTAYELEKLHGLGGAQVETVQNWLPRDYNRSPSAEQLAAVRARYGLPETFWLYVGGYRRNKNLPLLIRAYSEAARVRPLPPLVLAGEMPEEDTPFTGPVLETLAAHPRTSVAAIRPGFVADADLSAFYRLARLVICPSSYEGFGYPVIEAAAVGAPVLAARATSFPELVSNPDCLFSPDDPAELTARLLAAVDSVEPFRFELPVQFLPEAGEARLNAALARRLDAAEGRPASSV